VKTDEHGIAYYKCTGAGMGTDVFEEACIGTASARTAQALWISDDVDIDLRPLDATLKVNKAHNLTATV
jgi:hypothetical protein